MTITQRKLHAEHMARRARLWPKAAAIPIAPAPSPPPLPPLLLPPPPPVKMKIRGIRVYRKPIGPVIPLAYGGAVAIADRITVRDIVRVVAHSFDVDFADVGGDRARQSRRKQYVIPRQIAMALARRITGASLPQIGRAMGGFDHTTVLHAIARTERNHVTKFADKIAAIMEELGR